MGFWDLFKKKKADDATSGSTEEAGTPLGEPPPPPGMPKELARLLRVGMPGGPSDDEAMAAFAALRGTPDEGRMIEELMRSVQMQKLPDPLLLALGATLLDRGEPEGATRVLSAASSSSALVLLADLAEQRGGLRVVDPRDEHVLTRSGELARDPDDLLGGLSLAEDHLRYTLSQRPMMIDHGEAEIGKGELA